MDTPRTDVVEWYEKQMLGDKDRIAALEAEVASLKEFRVDVTTTAIHAHPDTEGGLRYDEVANAVRRLGEEVASLKGERDALRRGHAMKDDDAAHYEDGWRKEVASLKSLKGERDAKVEAFSLVKSLRARVEELEEAATMRRVADVMPDACVPIGRKLLDSMKARVTHLEGALREIAYEPIGHPEATPRKVLQDITEIARAALKESGDE